MFEDFMKQYAIIRIPSKSSSQNSDNQNEGGEKMKVISKPKVTFKNGKHRLVSNAKIVKTISGTQMFKFRRLHLLKDKDLSESASKDDSKSLSKESKSRSHSCSSEGAYSSDMT